MKGVFLAAADTVRPLLDLPELADRWEEQSALERMSIGALAAHLSRAVTVVPTYLDEPGTPPFRDPAAYFLTVAEQLNTDLDSEVSVVVRSRAEAAAEPGLKAVVAQWDAARSAVADRVTSETKDEGISVLGGSMKVGDYLVTRVVELVIHGDDLAVSLGQEPPQHCREVYETVVSCLVEIATRRSSPQDVIRAMSRVERARADVPRAF